MAFLFESWWSELFFTVILGLLAFYVYFKKVSSKFWKERNVPHFEAIFLVGNTWRANIFENICETVANMYFQSKHNKVMGFWTFMNPSILVNDLEVVKSILTTDFAHFRDRMPEFNFDNDPLSANLFNLTGAKWRNLRVKLVPTFTSGKMKMMFNTIVQCGKQLKDHLKGLAATGESVEIKDIMGRFTTDVIGSCAFGIETNSLKNPDSEFRVYGKKIFTPNLKMIIGGVIVNISPKLFSLLGFSFVPPDVSKFFIKVVRDTIDYREKNNVKRNDFLQLLIQLKNKGKLEDVDASELDFQENGQNHTTDGTKFTFLEAAAQAFVFFGAGFETSSTTLTFALYELAKNEKLQAELQASIIEVLKKHDMAVTYEAIQEMDYLDRVVQETLRMYPPVPFLFRECKEDYEIPEMKVKLPKGKLAIIPIYAFHMDPEYFPNPKKFDPNRFTQEEKEARHHYAHLPFGEGPRSCIGNRFGLMQTKVGLVSILSDYSVRLTEKTPRTIKFQKSNFVLDSDVPIQLKFVPRE